MKLKAVAEIHPLNLIYDLDHYIPRNSKFNPLDYFYDYYRCTPMVVYSSSFWHDFYAHVGKNAAAHHTSMKIDDNWKFDPPAYSDKQFRRIMQLSARKFRIARAIWQHQASIFSRMRPSRLYKEGRDEDPVSFLASYLGSDVVFLDKNNPFYAGALRHNSFSADPIPDPQNRRLQADREDVWLSKMTSCDGALIIAGECHLKGDYGLVRKLSENGVQLDVLEEYANFRMDIVRIYSELQNIFDSAMVLHNARLKSSDV